MGRIQFGYEFKLIAIYKYKEESQMLYPNCLS